MSIPNHSVYLGDGVYGHFDGFQLWIQTERDGIIHEIALEQGVLDSEKEREIMSKYSNRNPAVIVVERKGY